MRVYNSIIFFGLVTISLSVYSQQLTISLTPQMRSTTSDQLISATQTQQEGYKRPAPGSPPRPIT
jgi:hypothetical protein